MNFANLIVKIGIVFIASAQIVSAEISQSRMYLSYHQRLAISYLLLGAGASEDKKEQIAKELKQELVRHLSAPRQDIVVKSFDEFLNQYRGNWPNAHSLEADLKILRARSAQGLKYIRGNSPELQQQIESFLTQQKQQFASHARENDVLSPIAGKAWESVTSLSQHRILNLNDNSEITDFIKRWIFKSFDISEKLLNASFEKVQRIGAINVDTENSNLPPGMTGFVLEVLKQYFNRLGNDSKKQILSQLMGIDLNASKEEKFEVMVLNSGPQFQKLLQVLARESNIPENLAKLFKKLESNVMPVPSELASPIIEAGRDAYQIISFDKHPLGVGTLAQTHKAVIQSFLGPQEVVIRFLKPGIEKRVDEDARILREVAPLIDKNPKSLGLGLPKVAPLVDDLTQTVIDELSIAATIGRQLQGRTSYSQEVFFKGKTYRTYLQIIVPNVIAPQGTFATNLHVQELAAGEKLDKLTALYEHTIPDLKKVIIEEISKVWIQGAIFGNGFYHSDLHQGNFLVEVTDPQIRVAILDFGMGGTLSNTDQSNIVSLSAGVELLRPDIIAKSLWGLSESSRNEISFDKFLAAVNTRASLIRKNQISFQGIDKWSTWASNQGIRFPATFVGFNRGLVILEKSLQDAGSNLTVAKIGKILAAQNSGKILSNLRREAKLDISDFIKLGWITGTGANTKRQLSTVKMILSCNKTQLAN